MSLITFHLLPLFPLLPRNLEIMKAVMMEYLSYLLKLFRKEDLKCRSRGAQIATCTKRVFKGETRHIHFSALPIS